MQRIAFSLLVVLLFSLQLRADEPDLDVHCEGMTPKKKFSVCIVKTKGSTNQDIIFHLHQANGGEKDWIERWKATRDVWRANGFEPPAVATVNFGPIWFLAEKNPSRFSGLFGFYLNTVIPWIENKVGHRAQHKILVGESMGGFNAAQFYFKKPKLFSKVAIVCPAFTVIGPQSTDEEIQSYIERTKADPDHIKWLTRGQKAFFPSAKSWENADVFQLAKNYTADLPPLFLSCGTEDDWGFYEGTSLMAQMLKEQNTNTTWFSMPGNHCARPYEQLANFIQN